MTQDTKARILDAAEARFAEHGFDGTSMRSLTTQAGVNLSAVNYHFGSKEALLTAVLARRLEPINRRRLELLDRLQEAPGSSELNGLLRAFFEPAFQELGSLGSVGNRFLQLAGRLHSESNPDVRRVFLGMFREVIRRFVPAFRAALPEVDDAGLHWRLHFMVGAMAHSLAWSPHEECAATLGVGGSAPPDSRDPHGSHASNEALEALVAFCAAGMRSVAPGRAEVARPEEASAPAPAAGESS